MMMMMMLGYSFILYISYINLLYTMLIQFHYIHMLYNIVEFSIIITIYRRNRHDYNYNNSFNHHHHFIFIILSCLISSLILQNGQTALHLASMYGKLETVRTLLELGVEKEAKDKVRNLMMLMMMMMMMMMTQTIVKL